MLRSVGDGTLHHHLAELVTDNPMSGHQAPSYCFLSMPECILGTGMDGERKRDSARPNPRGRYRCYHTVLRSPYTTRSSAIRVPNVQCGQTGRPLHKGRAGKL